MTIIILTIIAIIAFGIGVFIFFKFDEGSSYDQLIAYRCESIIFILTGVFILLLAILFKMNAFW